MLFEHVAGPTGADGAPGVFCCGLRVVSMDGSVTDVPDSEKNAAFFGRPCNQSRDGAFPQARWVAAAASGTGSLLGAAIGRYTDAEQPLAADLLGCFGPGMLVLADRKFLSWSVARAFLATGAHPVARLGVVRPQTGESPGRRHVPGRVEAARKKDGPAVTVRVMEYTGHTTAADGGGRPRKCYAWSPVCSTCRSTRRWTWPAATRTGGAAGPSSATTRPTWEKASPSCAPATPRGSCTKCGHCSPSTRPSASSPGSP
jgi:hypothetical protein